MTVTLSQAIQSALCEQLKAANLGLAIAWPWVTFNPVADTAYIAVHPLMRSKIQHVSVSFSGSNVQRGIFQVDTVIPDSQGEAPALALTDQIAAQFAIGTNLVANGIRLQIDNVPQSAAPVTDAPWVRYPVSIPYLLID